MLHQYYAGLRTLNGGNGSNMQGTAHLRQAKRWVEANCVPKIGTWQCVAHPRVVHMGGGNYTEVGWYVWEYVSADGTVLGHCNN